MRLTLAAQNEIYNDSELVLKRSKLTESTCRTNEL